MTVGMGTGFGFHIHTLLRRERRFVAGLVAPDSRDSKYQHVRGHGCPVLTKD